MQLSLDEDQNVRSGLFGTALRDDKDVKFKVSLGYVFCLVYKLFVATVLPFFAHKQHFFMYDSGNNNRDREPEQKGRGHQEQRARGGNSSGGGRGRGGRDRGRDRDQRYNNENFNVNTRLESRQLTMSLSLCVRSRDDNAPSRSAADLDNEMDTYMKDA